jgi:hypothetical protein
LDSALPSARLKMDVDTDMRRDEDDRAKDRRSDRDRRDKDRDSRRDRSREFTPKATAAKGVDNLSSNTQKE